MKKKVIVGMSGGVDSSVTAALLQERGFDVRGVYMKNWIDPEWPCPWIDERRDAMAVCAKLGIPFETWDFSKEYYEAVTEYMIREYKDGRTPNPDVMCNREIKFGVFLDRALKEGADYIATGHYVRLRPCDTNIQTHANDTNKKIRNIRIENSQHSHQLLMAKDTNKDQSYFLWTLTQNELKHCLFPIGEYTKPEVRELAKKFGLPTAEKKDSQGICFVGKIPVREFLKTKIPERMGDIVTTDGKVIGEHSGVVYFTIGQRHGIGVPGGSAPLYVVEKDYEHNRLIVGNETSDKLYSKEFLVKDVSWISNTALLFPLQALVRTRYRAPMQVCEIFPADNNLYKIICEKPERAVTSGQSAVFYRKDEVLGGGVIY